MEICGQRQFLAKFIEQRSFYEQAKRFFAAVRIGFVHGPQRHNQAS